MLVFQGPPQPVQCLAFVPGQDGGWLAAGHRGTLVLWPLAGGDRVEFPLAPADQVQGTHGLEEIAISPDGKWIAGRWYRGVRFWQRRRGRWIEAGQTSLRQLAVAFRQRDFFLVGDDGSVAEILPSASHAYLVTREPREAPNPIRVLLPHPDNRPANAGLAVLSPDGRKLATAAREKSLHLFSLRPGKHLGTLPQRGFVEAIAWSPDGDSIALNAGTTVRLYDVKSLAERRAWTVKYSYRPQVAFSPDGRLVATTDTGTGVHIWESATGALRTTLRAGRERRVPVAFAPDGLTIAAGGANGSVAVWDV